MIEISDQYKNKAIRELVLFGLNDWRLERDCKDQVPSLCDLFKDDERFRRYVMRKAYVPDDYVDVASRVFALESLNEELPVDTDLSSTDFMHEQGHPIWYHHAKSKALDEKRDVAEAEKVRGFWFCTWVKKEAQGLGQYCCYKGYLTAEDLNSRLKEVGLPEATECDFSIERKLDGEINRLLEKRWPVASCFEFSTNSGGTYRIDAEWYAYASSPISFNKTGGIKIEFEAIKQPL